MRKKGGKRLKKIVMEVLLKDAQAVSPEYITGLLSLKALNCIFFSVLSCIKEHPYVIALKDVPGTVIYHIL